MTDSLLVRNGTVVTLGESNQVLPDHSVLIENGLIKKIAPNAKLKGYRGKSVDASGKVVMPGLINAHMHFYSTQVRGLAKAAPSRDFNEVLNNLWWRLDRKLSLADCYVAAMVPLLDAIRHGTTTLIDHHASPFAARGSLGRIADAVNESGLRACLCYEVSDRDGEKVTADGIEENVAFIKQAKMDRNERLTGLFGLHAAFTLGNKTLEKAATLGRELQTGFHIHVAEARSDEDHSVKNHGLRVVERLHRLGILGDKTIAAHCVHVDEHEMDLLAQTKTAVVHNPQSNMNNAVGIADILKLMEKGVLVGLGTDAMTVNMREEMRVALWAQHLRASDASVAFVEAVSTLLFNNAQIANRYFRPKLGALQEGFAGDLIALDYQPPTQLDAGTFLGHFTYGLSLASVDTTVVGGQVLMEDKQLKINVDEAEVARKSRELTSKLWERF
jgi:putative selenium metabolism protein SsnA